MSHQTVRTLCRTDKTSPGAASVVVVAVVVVVIVLDQEFVGVGDGFQNRTQPCDDGTTPSHIPLPRVECRGRPQHIQDRCGHQCVKQSKTDGKGDAFPSRRWIGGGVARCRFPSRFFTQQQIKRQSESIKDRTSRQGVCQRIRGWMEETTQYHPHDTNRCTVSDRDGIQIANLCQWDQYTRCHAGQCQDPVRSRCQPSGQLRCHRGQLRDAATTTTTPSKASWNHRKTGRGRGRPRGRRGCGEWSGGGPATMHSCCCCGWRRQRTSRKRQRTAHHRQSQPEQDDAAHGKQ